MVLYELCEKEYLVKNNVLISEKLGQVPNDSESQTAPRVSPGLVLGRSDACASHGVTPGPGGTIALSHSPPTMTYLALPHYSPPPTHTHPLFLSRARSGIPAKLQGSREGYPL